MIWYIDEQYKTVTVEGISRLNGPFYYTEIRRVELSNTFDEASTPTIVFYYANQTNETFDVIDDAGISVFCSEMNAALCKMNGPFA
jgi:hypothetical protein